MPRKKTTRELASHHLPLLRENILHDIVPAFVVFLVAVPLCLGIALASGAPLFSGVVTGIIGGIIVGMVSGSHVSVSGPAAGLTIICATAIKDIGSYEGFLVAVFIAGILQIGFGLLRLGNLAEYCPNSVIKGMLAGIGAVIILKQIPHALGHDTDYHGDFFFEQPGGQENSMSSLLNAILHFHPTAAFIGCISLLILILWDRPEVKKYRIFRSIPGSLAVVMSGVLIDQLFLYFAPSLSLLGSPEHRVSLPIFESLVGIGSQIFSPNFSLMSSSIVLHTAVVIAIVASIESLLSVEASDKLDPYHRITSTNRELVAQGVGNTLSGLCGGLPLTAVIVRSSTNVYAGAKTKLSAIYHGVMLLIACTLLPKILNLIPLSSLAAVLIIVGYKLISPKTIKEAYRSGADQLYPFLATFFGIIFTDLLTGVGIGLCVGLFYVLKTNHHDAMSLVSDENNYLMRLNKDVSFVNKAEMKRALRQIPDQARLLIDGTKAMFIDKDIYDLINEFEEQSKHRDITVELKNVTLKSLALGR